MKTKSEFRIVYMGTPDFAVESLKALVEGGYNVVAVVTMPDKPIGRGYKLQSSPVKNYAVEHSIPVLQPTNLKDESFVEELRSYRADLQIVVAFRMLPEVVWAMPAYGTFNLHASLLPQYRGAAPINWAIINGEKETGVTTFFLQHAIDTGNIILQERIAIADSDTAGDVHDALMMLGASCVVRTVDMILDGTVSAVPQAEVEEMRAAPKIFKETCCINWTKRGAEVVNLVRGLSPYPAAWFELEGADGEMLSLKVYEAAFEPAEHQSAVGDMVVGKSELKVAVVDGYVSIKQLQLAGKRRMAVDEFLRGYKQIAGCRIK